MIIGKLISKGEVKGLEASGSTRGTHSAHHLVQQLERAEGVLRGSFLADLPQVEALIFKNYS